MLSANELGDAKVAFEKALDMYQGSEARIGLARVEMVRERWKPAIRHLERALRKDPENVAARYHLANAYRESVKGFNYIDSKYMPDTYENTWEKASEHYEWILARDSMYQDILYQYAVYWKYARKPLRAMSLAHEQTVLKPELKEAQTELIRMFNYMHASAKRSDMIEWLDSEDSAISRYLRAELWRRDGELNLAEEQFIELFSVGDISAQLLYLSLARIHFARSKIEEGQAAVETAIQEIQSSIDAAYLFEEFKYIVSPEELAMYQAIDSVNEFQGFFRQFLLKRDPMPSRPVNARLAEHYRRFLIAESGYLYRGFRLWHNSADPLNKLGMPETTCIR